MEQAQPGNLTARRVGDRLAEARRAQGLDLEEVASRTRVPLRHLEAIEAARYAELPAVPYATGFVRSYATLLGLDGVAMARDFRVELGGREADRYATAPFEPADPARIPPKWLVWTALAIAVLLVAGYTIWRSGALGGDGPEDRARLAARTSDAPAAPAPAASAPHAALATAPAGGAVVLTATDAVWLRVKDGDNRLIERALKAGESFAVPGTATAPELLTGRPQALKITVGSTVIPQLGPADQTVNHVSLKPQALLARLQPGAASPPAAAPATAPPAPADAPTRQATTPRDHPRADPYRLTRPRHTSAESAPAPAEAPPMPSLPQSKSPALISRSPQ